MDKEILLIKIVEFVISKYKNGVVKVCFIIGYCCKSLKNVIHDNDG